RLVGRLAHIRDRGNLIVSGNIDLHSRAQIQITSHSSASVRILSVNSASLGGVDHCGALTVDSGDSADGLAVNNVHLGGVILAVDGGLNVVQSDLPGSSQSDVLLDSDLAVQLLSR